MMLARSPAFRSLLWSILAGLSQCIAGTTSMGWDQDRYLQVLGQELVLAVLVHALVKGGGCLAPFHAVRELS